jgi:hypothetical protein
MPQPAKPNPYCGFKDDRERRRALNFRCGSYALAVVAAAWAPSTDWSHLRWLISLFH